MLALDNPKIDQEIDLSDYIFLAKAVSFKFHKRKFERIEDTDTYSIALLGLAKAKMTYTYEVGNDFSRYAYQVIKNEIINDIKYRKRAKRIANFEPLNDLQWQSVPDKIEEFKMPNLSAQFFLRSEIEDTEQDKEDKSILIMFYIEGKKITEIADKFNLTRATIYNRINRIIAKIRERHSKLIDQIDETYR